MQIKKMAVSAAIVAALAVAGVTKDKEPRRCKVCGQFMRLGDTRTCCANCKDIAY